MNKLGLAVLFVATICCSGCYGLRSSSGGAQADFNPPREINAADIALPSGYTIEPVARDLTFPTGAAFDTNGVLYVIEAGYSYGEAWQAPRLLRIDTAGLVTPIATGGTNGPWTGVVYHEGAFYVAEGGTMEGGRILRVSLDGTIEPIVEDLPSYGDHHTDGPAISPEGWLYFGVGTASNSGVVGEDNYNFGWLKRRPEFRDIPPRDITLIGENFESKNFLDLTGKGLAITGAFQSFGTAAARNQEIPGSPKGSGAIYRVRPDGSNLELVAWGFRNPFGLAFSPEGELYATDNGYDERGSRPVWGAPDLLWRVQTNLWYGWPDYSGNEPLTLDKFKPPGKSQPGFLLASHPNKPPEPVVKFGVHSSADGLDFSRSADFGHVGDAFVAELGDEAPATGKMLHPVGFKVVRVDVKRGVVYDFAVNKNAEKNGPASLLNTGGLERPVAVKFDPSGRSLYVVDFGPLPHDETGAKPQPGTGVVWRIKKTNSDL